MNYGKRCFKKKRVEENERLVSNITEGQVLGVLLEKNNLESVVNGAYLSRVLKNERNFSQEKAKVVSNEIKKDISFLYNNRYCEDISWANDKTPLGTHKIKEVYVEEFDSTKTNEGKRLLQENVKKRQERNYAKYKQFKEIKYGRVIESKE